MTGVGMYTDHDNVAITDIICFLGAYFYIVWGIWLRHCLNGREDEYELVWPSVWFSLPRIDKVKTTAAAASNEQSTNGELKKAR